MALSVSVMWFACSRVQPPHPQPLSPKGGEGRKKEFRSNKKRGRGSNRELTPVRLSCFGAEREGWSYVVRV